MQAEQARQRGDLPTMHRRYAEARRTYGYVAVSGPSRGFVRTVRFTKEGLCILRSRGVDQLDESGKLLSRKDQCRTAHPRGYGFPIAVCDGKVTIVDDRGYADAYSEDAAASSVSLDERWVVLSTRKAGVTLVGLMEPVAGEFLRLKAAKLPELLALAADGSVASAVSGGQLTWWRRPAIQAGVSKPRPDVPPTGTVALPPGSAPPLDLAVSPNGKTIALVAVNGALFAFQYGRWSSLPLREPARAVTFSPDGAVIASVDAAGNIERFALPSFTVLARLGSRSRPDASPLPTQRGLDSVAYDAPGRRIAAGSIDGSVRVWTGEELAFEAPGHAEVQGIDQRDGHVVITSFLTEWRAPIDDLTRLAARGTASFQAKDQSLRIQGQVWGVGGGQITARDPAGRQLYTLHLLTDGGYYAVQEGAIQLGGSANQWTVATTRFGLRPWALIADRWQGNLLGGERGPLYRDEATFRYLTSRGKPILCGATTCLPTKVSGRSTPLPVCCSENGNCGVDLSHVNYPISLSRAGCVALKASGELDAQCPDHTQAIMRARLHFPGCRRPDGTCGHQIDLVGVNLGCTDLVSRMFGPQAR